jgi:hypothetical protein
VRGLTGSTESGPERRSYLATQGRVLTHPSDTLTQEHASGCPTVTSHAEARADVLSIRSACTLRARGEDSGLPDPDIPMTTSAGCSVRLRSSTSGKADVVQLFLEVALIANVGVS